MKKEDTKAPCMHDLFRRDIDAMLHGELDERKKIRFDKHLKNCRDCRTEFEQHKKIYDSLLLAAWQPKSSIKNAVLEKIELGHAEIESTDEEYRYIFPRKRRVLPLGTICAAAAVLVTVVLCQNRLTLLKGSADNSGSGPQDNYCIDAGSEPAHMYEFSPSPGDKAQILPGEPDKNDPGSSKGQSPSLPEGEDTNSLIDSGETAGVSSDETLHEEGSATVSLGHSQTANLWDATPENITFYNPVNFPLKDLKALKENIELDYCLRATIYVDDDYLTPEDIQNIFSGISIENMDGYFLLYTPDYEEVKDIIFNSKNPESLNASLQEAIDADASGSGERYYEMSRFICNVQQFPVYKIIIEEEDEESNYLMVMFY